MCQVTNGPGKFETQPCYAEEVYEIVLGGFADERFDDDNGTPVDVVNVDDDFRVKHDIDASVVAIAAWTDDTGFFSARELTQSMLDELRADFEE